MLVHVRVLGGERLLGGPHDWRRPGMMVGYEDGDKESEEVGDSLGASSDVAKKHHKHKTTKPPPPPQGVY